MSWCFWIAQGISTSQIKEDLGLKEAVGGVDQLPDEPDGAPGRGQK